MNEKQIKHMVNRFLGWRLPEDFSPDNGISFKKTFNEIGSPPMKHEPTGTDLFDATQALAMVRYLVEGLPIAEKEEPNLEWEAKAETYHAAALAEEGDVNPFDTLTMLERWKADAEPANSLGQVSFSRALLDGATDGLRTALEMARNEDARAKTAETALAAANARAERLEGAANHLLSWFCEAERPIVPRWREDIPGTSIRKILDQFRAALAETPTPGEDTP